MLSFLTGATGFIGAHVARALLARGERVRCLVRKTSNVANLEGLDVEHVERVEGDLRAPESYRSALTGVDAVFHCAADYRLYSPDPRELYAVNVAATRALFEACLREGIAKVVHTSSVGALATRADGSATDEDTPVQREDLVGHYKRSKFDAERVAEEYFRRGLSVMIVNPSTPVGENDIKPTPTGKMILDFIRGRMPAYVDTGLNLIDVRDVAEGHVLARDRGRPGQKYILAHANLTLRQIFAELERLSGVRAPRIKLPHFVPLLYAAIDTAWARAAGSEPRVPLEAARMSAKKMFFDGKKAVRELGLPQSPIEGSDGALARAVAWFTNFEARSAA